MGSVKRKHYLLLALAIGVAAIGLWLGTHSTQDKKTHTTELQKVQVSQVQVKQMPIHIITYATVISPKEQQIIAQADGQLFLKAYSPGQQAHKGQTLFKLSTADLKAELLSSKSKFVLAKRKIDMYNSLFKIHAVAAIEYEQVRANFINAKQTYQKAINNASFMNIKAPIDGVVMPSHFTNGSVIKKGDILTTIVPKQGYQVKYVVDQMYLNQIKPGMPIQFKQDNITYTGKVIYSAPLASDAHTFEVRASIDNKTTQLTPGMQVVVKQTITTKQVVVIDKSHVGSDVMGFYIFGVQSGIVIKKYFTATSIDNNNIIVKSGLANGSSYISSSIDNLAEGQHIEVTHATH